MKLVGYIRVSTDSQAENTSLTEQRKKIQAYCYALEHTLVKIYEEVGSGKDAVNRVQFQAALKTVAAEADGIIATKLDRIARNTRDVFALVEDVLQPTNKALVLLDLNVDTSTPTGRMILTVMSAVAQLERDVINERTQTGRKSKAVAGGYAYGAPAYGQTAVDGQLINSEDETEVIDLIRRHHKSGKSLRAIAVYLKQQGIKSKQGKEWPAQAVKNVIVRLKQDKTA